MTTKRIKSWMNCSKCARIGNTRFIASKTPLSKDCFRDLPSEEAYEPVELLERYPDIGLVIHLGYGPPLYSPLEIRRLGVEFHSVWISSRSNPEKAYKRFSSMVKRFLSTQPNGKLICVHCFHGLNRTGYFICRFLMENYGYAAEEAIQEFERYRGHAIQKIRFIKLLTNLDLNPGKELS